MQAYTWYDGSGCVSLTLTQDQVDSCSHQGSCDVDVENAKQELRSQLDTIDRNALRQCIKEYGTGCDLDDDEELFAYLIWIAANDCRESPADYRNTEE